MSHVKCPYCEKEVRIDHDDGYGYDENETYDQECRYCGMIFCYTTTIYIDHDAFKADCLNEVSEHDYRIQTTYPKYLSKMVCKICGKKRDLTEEEKILYNVGTKEEFMESLTATSYKEFIKLIT